MTILEPSQRGRPMSRSDAGARLLWHHGWPVRSPYRSRPGPSGRRLSLVVWPRLRDGIHRAANLRRHRERLRLTDADAYALTLMFSVGALAGGRAVQIAGDEWPLFRAHPGLAPALWLGGMATHGILLGALVATAVFARIYRKPFLELADALVIPGALLLGLGRIGNFIDGQIVGRVTDVSWAVKFPDADGFRHPVVLYDGLKNLLLIPYLVRIRRSNPTPGAVAARFVCWYASLRIVIDLFRD
ncbi:MAG TPA: prolipoprotein diacylglyceryl transferase [Vicinamibacterales bacterium]|nr:prolipoprotein diacylglyceryl transferase [Vicinamibacterales bacterium]